MNYEQEIKKLEAQIEELKQKIEAEKEAPPVWVPDFKGAYYLAGRYGVSQYHWLDDNFDRYYLKVGNLFKTKQEAESYTRALNLIETIRRERFKAQGNWRPSGHEARYIMYWDQLEKTIDAAHPTWAFPSDVFGSWRRLAALRDVIEKHGTELEWYFTEYLPSIN